MSKKVWFLVIASLAAASTPVQARDFLAYRSTTPLLYLYAACALGQDEPTAEAQLERCEDLRDTVKRDADAITLKFTLADRRNAQLNFKIGLREIDRDAENSRKKRKTVPTPILGYLRCMGERVIETDDYQKGIAVDYIGIEDPCAKEHIESVASFASEEELRRTQLLYRRFARFGRYVDNSSRLGGGIARTANGANARQPGRRLSRAKTPPFYTVMDRSFLNLAILPADKEAK